MARANNADLVRSDDHFGPVDPGCDLCKNNLPFEVPASLLDAFIAGKVVVFAGAGVSTESRYVSSSNMYEDLSRELKVQDKNLSFPAVMSRYVERHGRTALVEYILTRLDKIAAFPAQDKLASRFHREIAVVPQVAEIVTTNWDDYFERFTQAIPFVTDQDFAYWNLPRRKVFKIHGSIHNVGTIIATEEDYRRRLRELQRGVMGSQLKLALATKTILFVGYSFRDDDFNQLQRYLAAQMRDLLPQSFAVTLSDEPVPKFLRGRVIKTDAAFFVHQVRRELAKTRSIPSDRLMDAITKYRDRIQSANDFALRLGQYHFPSIIYTTSFQEGVMHAIDRAERKWPSGEYHDWERLGRKIHEYAHWLQAATRVRRYEDAAYIDGYLVGLQVIRGDSERLGRPPVFYLPGPGYVGTRKEFRALLPKARRLHKAATARAVRIVKGVGPNNLFTHTFDLGGVPRR